MQTYIHACTHTKYIPTYWYAHAGIQTCRQTGCIITTHASQPNIHCYLYCSN